MSNPSTLTFERAPLEPREDCVYNVRVLASGKVLGQVMRGWNRLGGQGWLALRPGMIVGRSHATRQDAAQALVRHEAQQQASREAEAKAQARKAQQALAQALGPAQQDKGLAQVEALEAQAEQAQAVAAALQWQAEPQAELWALEQAQDLVRTLEALEAQALATIRGLQADMRLHLGILDTQAQAQALERTQQDLGTFRAALPRARARAQALAQVEADRRAWALLLAQAEAQALAQVEALGEALAKAEAHGACTVPGCLDLEQAEALRWCRAQAEAKRLLLALLGQRTQRLAEHSAHRLPCWQALAAQAGGPSLDDCTMLRSVSEV